MSDIKSFLPNTEIGQNFLVDRTLLRCIVEAADIAAGEGILEIGPGQGVLSEALLNTPSHRLDAVELDRRLAPFLAPLQEKHPQRFFLHWGDAVRFDFTALPSPTLVVANIPYHITTPLLWKLLEDLAPGGLRRMVLMVQKEGAERLLAPLRSKTRYPLGVTLELMGTVRLMRSVPPEAFRPKPRVDSALIRIDISDHRDLPGSTLWRDLLRKTFGERRKMLRNTLKAVLSSSHPTPEACLEAVAILPTARPEELDGAAWLRLKNFLAQGQKNNGGVLSA